MTDVRLPPAAPTRAPGTPEPSWLVVARSKLGTREAPGPANSPTIMGWAHALGTKALGMVYNADSVPWCGLFVASCIREGAPTLSLPPIAVRASSWDGWGRPVSPCVGAVMRFARAGGGHVAFAVGEDAAAYHVLGGNQGDRVSITRVAKDRLVACRAPVGWTGPIVRLMPMTAVAGIALSRNEA